MAITKIVTERTDPKAAKYSLTVPGRTFETAPVMAGPLDTTGWIRHDDPNTDVDGYPLPAPGLPLNENDSTNPVCHVCGKAKAFEMPSGKRACAESHHEYRVREIEDGVMGKRLYDHPNSRRPKP